MVKKIETIKCRKNKSQPRRLTFCFGGLEEIRCLFAFGGQGWCCRRPAAGKKLSTGQLHLMVRISSCSGKTKASPKADFCFGGLEEIRTPDPHNANVVRSQLRYKPLFTYRNIIALLRAKVKQNLLNSRNFPGTRQGREPNSHEDGLLSLPPSSAR